MSKDKHYDVIHSLNNGMPRVKRLTGFSEPDITYLNQHGAVITIDQIVTHQQIQTSIVIETMEDTYQAMSNRKTEKDLLFGVQSLIAYIQLQTEDITFN